MNWSDLVEKGSRALVMSGFMSIALSGVFTFLAFGLTLGWLWAWFQSTLIAWPIAIGLDLTFGGTLRRLSDGLSRRVSQSFDHVFQR